MIFIKVSYCFSKLCETGIRFVSNESSALSWSACFGLCTEHMHPVYILLGHIVKDAFRVTSQFMRRHFITMLVAMYLYPSCCESTVVAVIQGLVVIFPAS